MNWANTQHVYSSRPRPATRVNGRYRKVSILVLHVPGGMLILSEIEIPRRPNNQGSNCLEIALEEEPLTIQRIFSLGKRRYGMSQSQGEYELCLPI